MALLSGHLSIFACRRMFVTCDYDYNGDHDSCNMIYKYDDN